ncbi:membrane protein [Microbacterium phage Nucci]|nr:membrane protein [Microbacterium phage Nucci]
MNPWDWVLPILGWFFLAMIVLGALIILFAIFVGALNAVRKWQIRKPKPDITAYNRESEAIALDMFKNDQMPKNTMDAFVAGARWGWGALHRKKK